MPTTKAVPELTTFYWSSNAETDRSRVWFSERDDGGEQAGWVSAACEAAAEVDGVERYVPGLGEVRVVGVGSAGRAGEIEDEGLAVAACPFSDDVGDDAAVVVRGEFEWPVQGAGRVGAVHP